LPGLDDMAFQYTVLELNTAVKPWALDHLLQRGHKQVLYIDPDIRLYRPLDHVFDLLDGGASLVLTPHLAEPLSDGEIPTELDIRVVGTYNLGFCGVSAHSAGRAFLRWWQGKLERGCVVDQPNGMFVDQSWVDLAPAMFDDVAVLRHPGYNAAYWNLAERQVTRENGEWHINGAPLAFFHFSGIDPQNPEKISKYQRRYTLSTIGADARELIVQYCRAVVGNGQSQYRGLPYGYARFDDGTTIAAATRTAYRLSDTPRTRVAHRPFAHPELQIETHGTGGSLAAAARLRRTFRYFLGREPDPQAWQRLGRRCASLPGYLRVALSTALSGESRRLPGWQLRLLCWPFAFAAPPAVTDQAKAPFADTAAPALRPPYNPLAARHDTAGTPPGINLVGYIAAELGLGEAARSLARACRAAGVPYAVTDVGYQSSNLQRDTWALEHAVPARQQIDLIYVNAAETAATVAHLAKRGEQGQYRIGFWHWEQPQLPRAHLAAFAHLDEVWVPSRFVHDAVAAVSPVPVHIVPHALEFAPTPGVTRAQFGLPDGKLLALVMYDFHSYQHRKNPQAAIAAFRLAAQGRHDCALVVKTINSEHHAQAYEELRAHLADLPDTAMLDRFMTRQEVWDLQSCCDMLISLHRAEGFGLGPAEMMYLGKPVVATGWSANMDFMTHENSMPVRYTLQPLRETIGAYEAGPDWAEADVGHAASCIARLLDDPQLRAQLGARAQQDVRAMLAPDAVGKRVAERLRSIAYWHPEVR
ncbi:MAG TPA: glycosyltransferase family 4 protein, partial [Burkholderiaceae bacterium]